MKIVLANNCLGRAKGGIEAWIYHAAEALLALGHEPVLVAYEDGIGSCPAPDGVRVVGVKRCAYRIPLLEKWQAHMRLRSDFKKLGEELRPDAWWIRSGLMAGSIVGMVDAPVLFIQAANMPEYARMERETYYNGRWLHDLYKKVQWWPYFKTAYYVENRGLEGSCANVYLSKSRRQEMSDYYGEWVSGKSHVIPPGVDLKKFTPSKSMRDDGVLRLVSVCRLVKDKNIQQVIRAVALLVKKGSRIQYRIAGGDGGYEPYLRTLIQTLGVEKEVVLVGETSSVEEFYRWGDVFVLPSVYEGFGNVYLEAMASGLPCLALRPLPGKYLVATDEIILSGETGILTDNDEPETLARAIERFHDDAEALKRMKLKSRNRVEEAYDWRKCVESLMALTRS